MSDLDKETMARLRAERKPLIEAAKRRVKEQVRVFRLIRQHLEKGPDTVPGLAQSTGLEPGQVLWHLTAMRKYGLAQEGDKQGGYFLYALAQTEPGPER